MVSPLLIGSGRDDVADAEVLKLNDQPLIPGSSLAGACIHFMVNNYTFNDSETLKALLGKGNNQSHFIFDFATTENTVFSFTVRDSVRIQSSTNTAKDKGKYDYEVLEPGIKFSFCAEAVVRESMDMNVVEQFLATVDDVFKQDLFRLGAQTNTGFGQFKVLDSACYKFDFTTPGSSGFNDWIGYCQDNKLPSALPMKPVAPKIENKVFSIDAVFSIKTSLITGASGGLLSKTDKTQLSSNGKNVISGKSLKGAIRHRALKILNTLNIEDAENKLKDFMGFVDDEAQSKDAIKSRIKIDEVILSNPYPLTKKQTRIKIDRFTGGTIKGALFEATPLWNEGDSTFNMKLHISNYEDWMAGLLLLVLKDLWTGFLPIGGEKNIGRGVLVGHSAAINCGGKIYRFDSDGNDSSSIKVVEGNLSELETLVASIK
jgi:CRISPR/Cas system CSM-associated protein Csm3 (group 7 of RAMP superfamily)